MGLGQIIEHNYKSCKMNDLYFHHQDDDDSRCVLYALNNLLQKNLATCEDFQSITKKVVEKSPKLMQKFIARKLYSKGKAVSADSCLDDSFHHTALSLALTKSKGKRKIKGKEAEGKEGEINASMCKCTQEHWSLSVAMFWMDAHGVKHTKLSAHLFLSLDETLQKVAKNGLYYIFVLLKKFDNSPHAISILHGHLMDSLSDGPKPLYENISDWKFFRQNYTVQSIWELSLPADRKS
jgi:hypothetical protein